LDGQIGGAFLVDGGAVYQGTLSQGNTPTHVLLAKTTDRGLTTNQIPDPFGGNDGIVAVAGINDRLYVAGESRGITTDSTINYTTDGGATWLPAIRNGAPFHGFPYDMKVSNGVLFVTTVEEGFCWTSDYVTWHQVIGGNNTYFATALAADPSTGVIVYLEGPARGGQYSLDNGQTWSSLDVPPALSQAPWNSTQQVTVFTVLGSKHRIVVTGSPWMAYTDDYGLTWHTPSYSGFTPHGTESISGSSTTLVATVNLVAGGLPASIDHVIGSTDGGLTWNLLVDQPFAGGSVQVVSVVGADIWATGQSADGSRTLARRSI
jgi:hypothetical protein